MPINYQEGKIYKIYNTINDDIYVGSTTRKLSERMAEHRRRINHKDNHNLLYQSFIKHGVINFYIELLEKYTCSDKEELHKKEGEYIRGLKPSLNIQMAGRTAKEYREDNREHMKEYTKLWQENNKEYIREYNKQYYENNKEHTKEQYKQYREHNKEYIREKITCECGCIIARGAIARHRKTKKHKDLMILIVSAPHKI